VLASIIVSSKDGVFMKYIFVAAFFIFSQFSLANEATNEQEQKLYDSLEKATANVQAWINGVKDDPKQIGDEKMIGTVLIDVKKNMAQQEHQDFYSRSYPGNLEIYDVKLDTGIPGIVYFTTTPDYMPHMIIYFQTTDPEASYARIFKETLTNPENLGFQLSVDRIIDFDTQQENSHTIKVMAKDLKLKRPSDNSAIDLKEIICPVNEPGIGDKVLAFVAGKKVVPAHTDCL
jgi:hypothetical protein